MNWNIVAWVLAILLILFLLGVITLHPIHL